MSGPGTAYQQPAHYTDEDRQRTGALKWRAKDALLGRSWWDSDKVASELGCRVGTLLSKMREFNDYHHAHHGLLFDSRRVKGGRWEYRLIVREPAQMPLFEGAHAA